MKIIKILKPEDIHPGDGYIETIPQLINDSNITVENLSLRYEFISTPGLYVNGSNGHYNGNLWILGKYVWSNKDKSEIDSHSLTDMGVTKNSHNGHKLYRIIEGDFEDIENLTLEELDKIAQ
jgi:hypothetical protein